MNLILKLTQLFHSIVQSKSFLIIIGFDPACHCSYPVLGDECMKNYYFCGIIWIWGDLWKLWKTRTIYLSFSFSPLTVSVSWTEYITTFSLQMY